MYKQSTNQKSIQKKSIKPKEIKLIPNYIPVKKTQFQSNISENETEPSIQKNFSNKTTKKTQKPNLQAKSVQIVHSKQFSPKVILNNNTTKRVFSNNNKLNSNHGSFYNLNYLNNNYDYSNEKKIIENKNKKINTLRKQLSLYIQQINFLEKNNEIFSEFQNNLKNNISQISYNSSHSANKNSPKVLYINNNNNKCFLINNNSYVGYPSNNDQKINDLDNANKKLEKKLSNFLIENNSDNNFINRKHNCIKDNNNILNIIYQSKKGYRYKNINIKNNNNYNNIDNKKINSLNSNNQAKIKKEISFKNNNYRCFEQQKNNVYLYTNKESIQKIPIIENKNNNNENKNNSNLDNQYQILNEKAINLFNNLFDYYNQKVIKQH